jgi:hypothetical protein
LGTVIFHGKAYFVFGFGKLQFNQGGIGILYNVGAKLLYHAVQFHLQFNGNGIPTGLGQKLYGKVNFARFV